MSPWCLAFICGYIIPLPFARERSLPDLYEASLTELQLGLEEGHFTSFHLVKAYLSRIEEVNLRGPALHAIIETNPAALTQALNLDLERRKFGSRGPLHGIPIIVKDSIATAHEDGMNTTAGSYALLGSMVPRSASVVDRLHDAGVIILGKSNMSEWADFRGWVSGWSARGGQSTSPFYPNGDAEGSSSGSAIAAAIGLAGAALGTETDGSIITPACRQNVVGLKPTVGLTSRAGIIPVSEHQDSAGILARCVTDAALVLSAIAGKDPRDEYTFKQPDEVPNYLKGLDAGALQGVRLGVPRNLFQDGPDSKRVPEITVRFNQALKFLEKLGAIVVDPVEYPAAEEISRRITEQTVMLTELRSGLEQYMKDLVHVPSGTRTLADLIAFNSMYSELELPPGYEDQNRFVEANSLPRFSEAYCTALERNAWLGTEGSIDYALKVFKLDALVMPSRGKTTAPAALAGYPMISVPLGYLPQNTPPIRYGHTFFPAPGMPFGIAFTSSSFTESKLLNYAYAFEYHTKTRLERRAFPDAIPKTQLTHVI